MESNFIDWHPADIIAGLRKKGTSMAAESRRNGLSSSTLANALSRPWPKGEMIIAKALGTDPWVIWPSRYHDPQTHEFIDRTQLMRSYTKPKNGGLAVAAYRAASFRTITRAFHAQYLHLKRAVVFNAFVATIDVIKIRSTTVVPSIIQASQHEAC